ncbi:hypothetical protein, partial [Kurthia sp. ISK08]|uniref:hypothetical protein n=1 Tax=Kurthia sp. ISK08 TaxID=3385835 RepID=UPI0038FD1A70
VFQKGETLKRFKEDCQRARRPDRQKRDVLSQRRSIYIHVQGKGNPHRIQQYIHVIDILSVV